MFLSIEELAPNQLSLNQHQESVEGFAQLMQPERFASGKQLEFFWLGKLPEHFVFGKRREHFVFAKLPEHFVFGKQREHFVFGKLPEHALSFPEWIGPSKQAARVAETLDLMQTLPALQGKPAEYFENSGEVLNVNEAQCFTSASLGDDLMPDEHTNPLISLHRFARLDLISSD